MINKFMKINLKIILAIVLTAIICISGTVFATGYFASDVKYKKEDGTETNVEKALNELYNRNFKKEHTILYSNTGLNLNYTYTIKKEDLDFKEIFIYVSAINDSKSVYDARVTVTGNNVIPISDDSAYRYTDNGLNISSKVYIGKINNMILNDTINIQGLYGMIIKIIGIK